MNGFSFAWADQNIVSLKDKSYDKSDVIRDFLEIAFSKSFWIEGVSSNYKELFSEMLKNYSQRADAPPKVLKPGDGHGVTANMSLYQNWLAKEFFRDPLDYPREGAINKWIGEISIGIDWPHYEGGKPNIDGKSISHSSEKPEGKMRSALVDSYPAIQEQIEALIPQIKSMTGLPVKFIGPNDAEDHTSHFARIRIVPTMFLYPKYFKKPTGELTPDAYPMMSYYEYMFLERVSFTPALAAQANGYLLPASNNSLDMTVCKVDPRVGDDLMKALVTECLIRSLGLPEVSTVSNDVVLGSWNKDFEEDMKSVADKDLRAFQFPVEKVDKKKLHFFFTPYDEMMARILYCPDIKPGMSKYQVLAVLARSDKCFHWKGE